MESKLYVQTEDHSSFKKIILSLDYLSELKCNFAYGNFKIHVICTAWCKTCLLPTPIPPHPSKRKEKIGHVTLLPWLFYVVKLWLDSWFKLKGKIDIVSYFPANNNFRRLVLHLPFSFLKRKYNKWKNRRLNKNSEKGECKPQWMSDFECKMQERDTLFSQYSEIGRLLAFLKMLLTNFDENSVKGQGIKYVTLLYIW